MTREQAARILYDEWQEFLENNIDYAGISDAYKMAIKALEQEPILDKIRAEIKEKFEGCDICEWFEDYDYEENDISEYQHVGDVSDILAIIDKYKAESEE